MLDLGCAGGDLSARLRAQGHHVTAVDIAIHPGVKAKVDRFVEGDLDEGIPETVGGHYDLILAADVLEHVRQPEQVLADARALLRPGGRVMVSIPNFGHWYPRSRVAMGIFDYDRRGILDATHVRFFTRRSFLHVAKQAGFEVARSGTTALPLEVLERGTASDATGGSVRSVLQGVDRLALALRPTLFAYQFLFELTPAPTSREIEVPEIDPPPPGIDPSGSWNIGG